MPRPGPKGKKCSVWNEKCRLYKGTWTCTYLVTSTPEDGPAESKVT